MGCWAPRSSSIWKLIRRSSNEAPKDAIAIHHIVEGNYVKPILKGTWATGPLKVTQEASAGKKLSPQEIQQLAEVKRLQVLDTKAKDLLNLINICITTGKYAVPTSAQYGLDKLYASDKLIAPSDVIDKATDTWVLGSGEPGCTSEFKNELKFRLRNETDFMKRI